MKMEAAMLTWQQQDELREVRKAEEGTEPPCPLCGSPRVRRSDYIRCNPCATNWLEGEDLTRNPRCERWEKFRAALSAQSTKGTSSTASGKSSGAPTAGENTPSGEK